MLSIIKNETYQALAGWYAMGLIIGGVVGLTTGIQLGILA